MRETKYTRAVLLPVVQASRSMSEVIRRLGLQPTGGNYRYIDARVRSAGIDISLFIYGSLKRRYDAFTRAELEPLVKSSLTLAQVLTKLGLPPDGRPHRELKRRVAELGLDTTHFRGNGWNRGETRSTHAAVERHARSQSIPDDDVFIENSRYLYSQGIIRRLLARGWVYACRECGITSWQSAALSLHLDHINGIHNDHRLVNLRFLCPNCHSQTRTYCRRKMKPSSST